MQKLKPFKIGPITVDPPLILAPMAGVTHSPFRQLVASFEKPGLFYSEMLSAKHLPHDLRKNSLWIQRTEIEHPMAYQIFAANADEAAVGCVELQEKNPEIIDLNLACPAPNIATRRKSGAYLLSDLGLIAEILSAMKEKVQQPLTAKIRLGNKPDLHFLRDLSAVLEECGVNAVTLHPRLTSEKLKRRARWEYIGYLKEMSSIPVIGNGDVKSKEDCQKMFAQTGCDGVMIGRTAVQKPWIFAEICGEKQELSNDFLQSAYHRHIGLITNFFQPQQALGRIKEFTWYYSKNLRFGHRFAARLQSIRTFHEGLEFIAENFAKTL